MLDCMELSFAGARARETQTCTHKLLSANLNSTRVSARTSAHTSEPFPFPLPFLRLSCCPRRRVPGERENSAFSSLWKESRRVFAGLGSEKSVAKDTHGGDFGEATRESFAAAAASGAHADD